MDKYAHIQYGILIHNFSQKKTLDGFDRFDTDAKNICLVNLIQFRHPKIDETSKIASQTAKDSKKTKKLTLLI